MRDSTISVSEVDYKEDPFSDADDLQFVTVGKKCNSNEELDRVLKLYDLPIVRSNTGLEYMNDESICNIFIVDNFEGDIFQQLKRAGCTIVGPPVLLDQARRCSELSEDEKLDLPRLNKPRYCNKLEGVTIAVSCISQRENRSYVINLIHFMSGSGKKNVADRSVEVVLANSGKGSEYKHAIVLGKPVLTVNWLYDCWEKRDDPDYDPMDPEVMAAYKVLPFSFCVLAFLGFSPDETKVMEQHCEIYGGRCVEPGAPNCTHLVVEDRVTSLEFELPRETKAVNEVWFWTSIQMEARAYEKNYLANGLILDREGTPASMCSAILSNPSSSCKSSKSRKRKRVHENIMQLAQGGKVTDIENQNEAASSSAKRRSDDGAGALSPGLGVKSPGVYEDGRRDSVVSNANTPAKEPEVKLSRRDLTIKELYSTEVNYTSVLSTICKIKQEVEEKGLIEELVGKHIFGNLPQIHELHVKVRDKLARVVAAVDRGEGDSSCVGGIFLEVIEDLKNVYPGFVNYVKKAQENLEQTQKTNSRFHATLKLYQNTPECGRQTLKDLFMRPVQRLPSVTLLLEAILKKTDSEHPDHKPLQQAFQEIKGVVTHINEEKRSNENVQALFDVVNDIENCPPYIISPVRQFISKIDAVEVTHDLVGRGEPVTIFLFTDMLEISKRRLKVLNWKSPGGAKTPQKAYKHLLEIPYVHVRRVINIEEKPECSNAFAMLAGVQPTCPKLYAFALAPDSEKKKEDVLRDMSRTICEAINFVDVDLFLAKFDGPSGLGIDTRDMGSKTLGKAAARFGRRVTRVFSLKQTPKFKRSITSASPLNTISRNGSGMLTPAGFQGSIGDLTCKRRCLEDRVPLPCGWREKEDSWDLSTSTSSSFLRNIMEVDENSSIASSTPQHDLISMSSIQSEFISDESWRGARFQHYPVEADVTSVGEFRTSTRISDRMRRIFSRKRPSISAADSSSLASLPSHTPKLGRKFHTVSKALSKKFL